MNQKILLIVAALAIIAGAFVAFRMLVPSVVDTTAAGQPTPLPFIPPLGMEDVTPGPTLTPRAVPEDAAAISAAEAREVFQGAVKMYQRPADRASASGSELGQALPSSAVLGRAGDFPQQLNSFAADYPLWLVSATGSFQPRSVPPGVDPPQFSRVTILIDATTGRVVGTQLSGLIQPAQ